MKTVPDLSKLEPLDGLNYRRWSQKLLMFFEQLEIDYVLFTDPPVSITPAASAENTPTVIKVVPSNEELMKKYDKDNKTVRCHLLNHMTNTLFDIFMMHKSSKMIWELLEKKYGADDAGKKKYVVGKWLQFQMVDGKSVMEQVHVYENLCADVAGEGMKLCDVFLANVLLEKFPPSWSDYRNHLKHKKKDLTLEELVCHMRTEEANRLKDKLLSLPSIAPKVNLVESSRPSHVTIGQGRGSGQSQGRVRGRGRGARGRGHGQGRGGKGNVNLRPVPKIDKPDIVLICYVCGKNGHKAYQCPSKKTVEANVAEGDDIIAAVVVEANLVGNVAEWVLDTGASRHLCADRGLFTEIEDVANGGHVYMGNSSSAAITGQGKIFLKLTSGTTLALSNVLYVSSSG